jgi:acetylornithine deacetylase
MASPSDLLAELIAFDTRNPGGDELALCRYLAALLTARDADQVHVTEVPRAEVTGGYVFARFGEPRLLFNVHIDTVPAQMGWDGDPHRADRVAGRVIGLGAADTKGAAAALLTALSQERPHNAAVLFSGDEERTSTCMQHFLASSQVRGIERAIVCEPTGRAAGVLHRGIRAYRIRMRGHGGHSSRADFLPKPIVTMARLAIGLDQLGLRYLEEGPPDMRGICLNVADIGGGVAFNVIPEEATLDFSVRPPPGFDVPRFEREVAACLAAAGPELSLEMRTGREGFACRNLSAFQELLGDAIGEAVTLHFWTEAALFARAGIDALVVGPGEIEQAHAANEFVSEDDLAWAVDLFLRAFSATRRS